jgi:hypothetical protein
VNLLKIQLTRKDRKQPEDISVYTLSVPSSLSRAKRLIAKRLIRQPKSPSASKPAEEVKGLSRWQKLVISKTC